MPAPATAQLWAERTPARLHVEREGVSALHRPPDPPAVLHRGHRSKRSARARQEALYYQRPAGARCATSCGGASSRRSRRCGTPASSAWCTSSSRRGCCAIATATRMSSIASSAWTGHTVSVEFRQRQLVRRRARACASTLAFERELRRRAHRRRRPARLRQQRAAVWEATHPALRARAAARPQRGRPGTCKGASSGVGPLQLRLRRRRARRAGCAHPGLAATPAQTHVVFNNNMEDQGQRNATTLMRILDELERGSGVGPV